MTVGSPKRSLTWRASRSTLHLRDLKVSFPKADTQRFQAPRSDAATAPKATRRRKRNLQSLAYRPKADFDLLSNTVVQLAQSSTSNTMDHLTKSSVVNRCLRRRPSQRYYHLLVRLAVQIDESFSLHQDRRSLFRRPSLLRAHRR